MIEKKTIKEKDLPDKEMREIFLLYEKSLNIPKKKHKKQFLVCPIGLVGAGKTTVVKPLSKKLSLLRVSSDEIRKLLNKKGFNYKRVKEMAFNIIKKYVQKGFSIAIDADCIAKDSQEHINKLVNQTKVEIFWIHINPPEKFIINKLKNYKHTWLTENAKDIIKNYFNRKPLHKNLNFPFIYKFDPSKDNLNFQINEAASLIKKKLKSKE